MTDQQPPGPNMLSLIRDGRKAVVVLGQKRRGLTDIYHRVLTMALWELLALLAATFLGMNLVFAMLYMLAPGAILGARPGVFLDAFFFSVETFATIGYGVMSPQGPYGNALMTVEAFFGLVTAAVTTGLIFARVSKPTSRVMFSKVAVVTLFDGVPTLMFRAANQRGNQILEAEAMVNLARQTVTAEGHIMRSFFDLPVVRARSPLFSLSWTIMHRLEPASPLYGVTEQSLRADGAEIIVVLSGTDDTFAQRIHARYVYSPENILWGKEFEDILSVAPDGRRVVDYSKFHDVRDKPPTPPH